MTFKDWLKRDLQKTKELIKPAFRLFGIPNGDNAFVNEQFKGEVLRKEFKFNKDLGEEHPFDFALVEGLYAKFPFVNGVIDKYVDFIVGPGFFVKSEDSKAEEIITQFLQDVKFDTLLRKWVKEALTKGTGVLEIGGSKEEGIRGLKVLDSKWVFIKRDEKGNIEKFNQLKLNKRGLLGSANLGLGDFTSFEPDQIALLTLNNVL